MQLIIILYTIVNDCVNYYSVELYNGISFVLNGRQLCSTGIAFRIPFLCSMLAFPAVVPTVLQDEHPITERGDCRSVYCT